MELPEEFDEELEIETYEDTQLKKAIEELRKECNRRASYARKKAAEAENKE